MNSIDPGSIAAKNRLLASFPPDARQRLLQGGEVRAMELKDALLAPDAEIEHVHFPLTSVVSLLAEAGRNRIEVATVGSEGLVGVPVFLGGTRSPHHAVVQVPGSTLQVPGALLRAVSEEHPEVREGLGRYTQAMMALMGQSVACNRLHPVEARCARWLLITRDRAGSASFPVTQQFLSQMLGVRRASATVAAGVLQRQGLIRYSRGKVTILDEPGLEAAACECYRVVADRYRQLLPWASAEPVPA